MSWQIGERLRAIRKRLGLTQKEAARRAGISPQRLWDLESGRIQNPSLRTLARLAKAYGMGVDELIGAGREFEPSELPEGLRQLLEDPEWGPQITAAWVETLSRLRYQGRPLRTKEEYLEAYLFLRRLFRAQE